MQHEKSFNFWPDPTGQGCKERICACMVTTLHSLLFEMQHDYFQKKNVLTICPHHRGQGCVYGQNICYHVAACIIPSNLICIITIFRIFDLMTPIPWVEGVCKDRIFAFIIMVLYAPFLLIWYATWLLSEKNVFTFWLHPRVCLQANCLLPCCCMSSL